MFPAKKNKGLLFVNKKKQKNFELWGMGCGAANAHGPRFQKFFGSFLQKRTCT
jgi:hypothetical protein